MAGQVGERNVSRTHVRNLPTTSDETGGEHDRPLSLECRSAPLSSRGLGRRILSPETGVPIPVAVWLCGAKCIRESAIFLGCREHFREQETCRRRIGSVWAT